MSTGFPPEPTPSPSSDATSIQGVPIDVPAGAAYVATFNSGTGRVVWAPTQAVGVQDVQADSPLSAGSDPAHPEISIASPIPVTLGGTGAATAALARAGLGIRAGTLTLASGTATVTDAATTANTRVVVTPTTINAGAGSLTVQYSHVSNSAGASFVVRANNAAGSINTLDTSVLDYIAVG